MIGEPSRVNNEIIDRSLRGYLFDIQRYSIHDGPGVRTTVFFKGCPLWCLWCSNPESQRPSPELFYHELLCIKCYRCVKVCHEGATTVTAKGSLLLDRERCTACGECAHVCPAEARAISGRTMPVGEVLDILRRDSLFYRNSGGGITVSGGEPTYQAEFLTELLKGCKSYGIHTALETAGYVKWVTLKQILKFVDLVLFDIKCMDNKKHKECTGVGNRLILENARRIVEEGKEMVIRYPLIPAYNDAVEDLRAVSDFMGTLGIRRVEILPYHRLSIGKYRSLGREYKLPHIEPCQEEHAQTIKEALESFGLEAIIA